MKIDRSYSFYFRILFSTPADKPPHRIRRIRIDIQPTRKPDRVFADKPSDLRIIVPIAVVVQPGSGVEVLTLKAQRVADAFANCALGTLFLG